MAGQAPVASVGRPPRAGRAPVTDGRAADRTTHWAEAVRRSAVLSLRCSAADWRTSRSAAACSLRPLTEACSLRPLTEARQFDVVLWPEPAGAVAGLRPEPAGAPQLARRACAARDDARHSAREGAL